MSDKRFQIGLNLTIAVLSFALGFGASYALQLRSERIQRSSLAKLIRATVANDLRYTIGTTGGIRDRIKKGVFADSPTLFNLLYSPTINLPSGDDLGSFEPDTVSAIDEYRRRLAECQKRRTEYLTKLKTGSDDYLEMSLFTYYIGLDSVVRSGINLISELDKEYPSKDGSAQDFANYSRAEEHIQELMDITNKAIADKGKANKAIEATK